MTLHFHPTSPTQPPTVTGVYDTGMIRVDMTSAGGDVDEYEFTVQATLALSQRLRDAAMSMQEFLKPRGG